MFPILQAMCDLQNLIQILTECLVFVYTSKYKYIIYCIL